MTGTETYCLDLLSELSERGHKTSVFTLSSAPQVARRVAATGAQLFTYPEYPAQPPERVIVMHPLATTLLLRKIDHRVPTLALIHSPWADEYPVKMNRIDRFIAVSEFIADGLRSRHGVLPHDVGVIQNGIDTNHYDAPPIVELSRPVRVLWGSVYHPDRHDALVAVIETVLGRDDLSLTVVDAQLPRGLVPAHDRIEIVPKRPDSRSLLEEMDVVCALGPGRILLEALAMNRAALCLNSHRRGEYVDETNRLQLEYYFSGWGQPVGELLTPEAVAQNANRRAVATRYYEKRTNFRAVIDELEMLRKRPSAPRRYRLVQLKRAPYLARAYAMLLESQAERDNSVGLKHSPALATYRAAKRILPARLRARLHRLAR